jgi:hypothetical protein
MSGMRFGFFFAILCDLCVSIGVDSILAGIQNRKDRKGFAKAGKENQGRQIQAWSTNLDCEHGD